MTPIILSPVPHCPKETVEAGAVEKSDYVTWAEEVAKDQGVAFVNLNRLIMAHYAGSSPAQIKERYFTPADNTHSSPAGAELNASCVVEGLRAMEKSSLKQYLTEPRPTTSPSRN